MFRSLRPWLSSSSTKNYRYNSLNQVDEETHQQHESSLNGGGEENDGNKQKTTIIRRSKLNDDSPEFKHKMDQQKQRSTTNKAITILKIMAVLLVLAAVIKILLVLLNTSPSASPSANPIAATVASIATVAAVASSTTGLACHKPYSSCNLGKQGLINVHIVSHTHNDLGWVKTVDQYFNGTGKTAYANEPTVKKILDNVIEELAKNPNRKFVYVEMGFFWMWWNQQNKQTKALVRQLVDEGRFEFLLGAWSMNDEATTYYSDIIDQQTLGFKFIKEEFGNCSRPRSAWQIDPFGHSREQASLFAQFGFDGLFLGRVDYQEFEWRSRQRRLEMLWQASRNLKHAQLFTSILPNVYWSPPGFCWEIPLCHDKVIIDNDDASNNVASRVDDFIKIVDKQARQYKTNQLIMTFGNDFTYLNAIRWFENIDKLITHVNNRSSRVNVFYSTPACYQYALNQMNADTKWELKYDDFMPYASQPHRYWTGFYTSRPALKLNVRKTSAYLHATRQLAALGHYAGSYEPMFTLERWLGIVQHHDGVSGTEMQYVANDYAKQMWIGVEKSLSVINASLISILSERNKIANNLDLIYCPLLNITECLPIQNVDSLSVIAYNTLPRRVSAWITVPIGDLHREVVDLETDTVATSDTAPIYPEINKILERKSNATYRLVFNADLPPLGFKVFSVRKMNTKQNVEIGLQPLTTPFKYNFNVKNEKIGLRFDASGNLIGVDNFESKVSALINQSLCYYTSKLGGSNDRYPQASGAYVFRPQDDLKCLRVRDYKVGNSKRLTEVHQVFSDWLSQTIRLYENSSNVEFEWQVGPIEVDQDLAHVNKGNKEQEGGKEVIMRFESDLRSDSTFFTDSNGREILMRKLNVRPTWPPELKQTEYVAGNYYPVNSRIFIRDLIINDTNPRQLTLLNDRSQGGASLGDGFVELMLHRRCLFDDGLGVNEPLNELIDPVGRKGLVVNGLIWLQLDTVARSARLHRERAHEINNRPLLLFNKDAEAEKQLKTLSGLSLLGRVLPSNLHLLTLTREYSLATGRAEAANSLLVRLEHFYEKDEDDVLSRPVTVNLKEILDGRFHVLDVEELGLGANARVDEIDRERLKWTADDANNTLDRMFELNSMPITATASDKFTFTFVPMQIRTFRLFYKPK